MKTLTLLVLICLSAALLRADEEEIRLEMGELIKSDLARSSAPFQAAAKTVKLLGDLSLAVETADKLDALERTIAPRLNAGECGLIKMPIYSTLGDSPSIPGQPIEYGISTKPVNLLVEKEVTWALDGAIGGGPPKGYFFDEGKSFFLCYSIDKEGKKGRGLVPYSTAMEQINDKGQWIIKKAFRDKINKDRPKSALSWICNYKHYSHASPEGCEHPELGGEWSNKGPTGK